jgi:hypothetical protein
MTDVNPEPRTIDEQVDRSIRSEPAKADLAELLEPPGQSRMVGDRDLQLEHLGQGTQEAFGLSERKVEDHANCQSCFDGDIRIGALTAGFPTGRRSPGVEGIIGKPDGEVTSSL